VRKISAQYILPVSSPLLKKGIVILDDNGKVLELVDTKGELRETANLEFYNGIICPGFILPYHPEGDATASFKALDSWLLANGVRGVGLLQSTGTHFREKQDSSLWYHTIIELCPEKDDDFNAFQSSLQSISDAWNDHMQTCSVTCCPRCWIDSDLPGYIIEYISTHQSIITVREAPDHTLDDQLSSLMSEWQRLRDNESRQSRHVPGHLLLIHDRKDPIPSGEKDSPAGLKTFPFPQLSDQFVEGGNKTLIQLLYEIQEQSSGRGLMDILPMFTSIAAEAIFADESLGSIAVGKKGGLNLITGIDFTDGEQIRLKENCTLRVF
jgi:hypothetical protein